MKNDCSKEYLLAVDGGGSKTTFCLYDVAAGKNSFYNFGSTNYKITRIKSERDVILKGISRIFSEAGIEANQILGLVMGMSGCDAPADYDHYLSIAIESNVAKDRIRVMNDSELAFYAKGVPPGLCMIAGTGSVATGISADGKKVRIGGWGSPISDEGSGGWIGIQVLKDLLRYCDGYGNYEDVFETLRKLYQAETFEEVPKKLSQCTMSEIASAARPTMDFADAGDEYCIKLVNEAAFHTAEIAHAVYAKLNFSEEEQVDVVMAGSLYNSKTFNAAFRKNCIRLTQKENIVFYDGVDKPVLGGIEYAKNKFLKV
jgi:N-acetylglucosamine kinase-like BadF-type ATPase